jgi:hypothetical protein
LFCTTRPENAAENVGICGIPTWHLADYYSIINLLASISKAMYPSFSTATLLPLTCSVIGAVALPHVGHEGPRDWAQSGPELMQLDHRDTCGFEGNPDLYGLGIRLGVYFQLFSSFLANHYHRDIMKDAWDTVRHATFVS